jgi:hypothetical protein
MMVSYPVTLDGQGYLLDLSTYKKHSAPTFAQKTRSGDPTYSDLLDHGALALESWYGGVEQVDYDPAHPDRSQLLRSLDPSNGGLTLGPKLTTRYQPGGGVNEFWSVTPYGTKLFVTRADGQEVYESADGIAWALSYNSGETALRQACTWFDRLAVVSGGSGKVFTYDGAAWALFSTTGAASLQCCADAITLGADPLWVGGKDAAAPFARLYSISTAGAATNVAYIYPYHQVDAICVHGNLIYYAARTTSGAIRGTVRYYDGSVHKVIANLADNAVTAMCSYRNDLYAASYTQGLIWRVDPSGLTRVFAIPTVTGIGGSHSYALPIYGMTVHNDRLYVSTADAGGIGAYQFDGNGWSAPIAGGLGTEARGLGSFASSLFQLTKSVAGARVFQADPANAQSPGTLITPWYDANLASLSKAGLRVTLRHSALAANEAIQVEYALDDASAYTVLGTSNTLASTSKVLTFSSVTFTRIRFRVQLSVVTTTAAPSLKALLFEYDLANTEGLRRQWEFEALFEGTGELPLITQDQAPEPLTGVQLSAAAWVTRAKTSTVNFLDLDGVTYSVHVKDLEEKASQESQRRGYQTRGKFTLVEA